MILSRTKSPIPFVIVLFLFCFASVYGQYQNKRNWNGNSFTLQRTFQDSLGLYQERGLLHVANAQIDKGSIFFKAYLISGLQHFRSSISSVLHVELVGVKDSIIKKQRYKILNGTVEGNMELPKGIEPGTYYLKAYTRWMKNYDEYFFAKRQIQIGEISKESQNLEIEQGIHVIPESGLLLNGYDNRIVVKLPIALSDEDKDVGRILNQNGKEVGIVKNYFGIGTGFFKPRKDMNYRMELKNGFILPLPMAKDQGCLMQVNNLDSDNINARITATSDFMESSIKLVGMLNGIKYFENEFVLDDAATRDLIISKEDLPKGVLVLMLEDGDGRKLAQRPVWIDGERLNIDISKVDKIAREPTYRIKVTDHNDEPISTQLAISVNKSETAYDKANYNLSTDWSDVLRQPEIKITNDSSADRNYRFLRDLIILSSVRDSIIDSFLDYRLDYEHKYPVQNGLEVIGYAYDLNNNLLVDTQIQIMVLNNKTMNYIEAKTGSNGLLKIKGLQVEGNTTLVFRTKGKDTKTNLVKVVMAEDWEIMEPTYSFNDLNNIEGPAEIWSPSGQIIDSTGLIELEEVQVNEIKPRVKKSIESVYGIDIPESRTKYQNPEKPKSIPQMISEIPGVTVSGMGEFVPTVKINRASGAGPVLFVVDGIPLSQGSGSGYGESFFDKAENSLVPLINRVSAVDVERIELMVGADASIYGSRASGGVILVYTRSGEDSSYIPREEGKIVLSGYEPVIDFETYQNELSKKYRKESSLLYWNPKLETDKNGEVIITLPPSIDFKNIRIEASTITPKGKVGWSSSIY